MGGNCWRTLLVLLLLHLTVRKGLLNLVFGCQNVEREALSKLKQSFNSDPADRLSSWKGEDCCQWNGVICNNVTGHVEILDLRNHLSSFVSEYDNMMDTSNVLSSLKLDPCLLQLRFLRYLDLSGNDFQGSPIPEFIGSMKHLRYLNLSKAEFSGVVPPQLGNLTRLKTLDLGGDEGGVEWSIDSLGRNRRSLVMSPSMTVDHLHWVSGLGDLQYLDMSVIDLTKADTSMEAINKLPSLSELRLRGCELGNTHISHAFYNNSTNLFSTLEHLDLSFNNLEGQFPIFFSNLSSLRSLNLLSNVLNGSIPLWLRNLGALESLILSWNSFSQVEGRTIMSIMGTHCKLKVLDLSYNFVRGGELLSPHVNFPHGDCYLENLDLRSNNITGTLPYWLGELRNLKLLALENNRFLGPIPTSIGNLSLLEELNLNDNGLSGSIPSSLGGLSSLKILDLSSNFLKGAVSESHLVNLSSLETLYLYNNSLKWELVSNWMPPFQLTDLQLGSCEIKGKLPQWIQTQKRLSWLDLSNTGISGNLPDWFWDINLQGLYLSHNHMTGPISHFSSQLSFIDLSGNLFSGPLPHDLSSSSIGLVPTSLCQLKNLEFLDLSKNELSGTIPNCWGRSESLKVINLSFNKLSGRIPESIGLNSELQYIKLNNNLLEGQIPPTLSNCTELELLDMGGNKLSGNIPTWSNESHPSLQILRLRANQLSGVIPEKLCSLPELHILDLAQNNLTGNIPHCFGRFSAMSLFQSNYDVSEPYDNLEAKVIEVVKGEELEYTTNLKLVENLDLSFNGLVGVIPEELTNLSGLMGLNLSHNHLIGNIPSKIGEMRALESLDLSNNNLSGTIPSSMSTLTSLNHLNLSCNKLHGEIPTGNQLQTLNDPSIYLGNLGLCGDPLPNKCTRGHDKEEEDDEEEEEEDDDDRHHHHHGEKELFYMVVMLGFGTGFWGVVGILLLMKGCRYALFQRMDDILDYIYIQVMVRINRLRN